MGDDVAAYLRNAHERAEELARGLNPGWWPGVALETRARAQECTPKRAFLGLVVDDEGAQRMTELFDLMAPDTVLARVKAERAVLEACETVLDGWYYEEAKDLARDVIAGLAAGWGWEEQS